MKRLLAGLLFSFGLLIGCNPVLLNVPPTASPTVFMFPPTWTPAATATQASTLTPVVRAPTPTKPNSPASSRTPLALSSSAGKIAFSSRRAGQSAIYVMNPDGSNVRRVTNSKDYEDFPAWSPDGKQLAFVSWTKEGGRSFELAKVFVINADGSGRRMLIDESAFELFPNWSPDGARIIFASGGQIGIVRVDGSQREMIVKDGTNNLRSPKWSPDGSTIVFSTQTLGAVAKALQVPIEMNIFASSSQGGSRRLITSGQMPAWSPDGTRIAFFRTDEKQIDQIFVINADGSGLTQLTKGARGDIAPDWSPDGSRIVFTSYRDGNAEIYVMNADGTSPKRLTNNAAIDMYPAWSR